MPKLALWLRLITIVHLAHNSSIIAVWRSQKHAMRLSTSQCFQHHENPSWTVYYFGYRMFPILAISVTSPWNVHTWPNWVSSAMRIIPLAKITLSKRSLTKVRECLGMRLISPTFVHLPRSVQGPEKNPVIINVYSTTLLTGRWQVLLGLWSKEAALITEHFITHLWRHLEDILIYSNSLCILHSYTAFQILNNFPPSARGFGILGQLIL